MLIGKNGKTRLPIFRWRNYTCPPAAQSADGPNRARTPQLRTALWFLLLIASPGFASTSTVEILQSFGGTAAQPLGELVEGPDGSLYGTAYAGGPEGLGSVFRLEPSGRLSVVVAFDGNNGAHPVSGLSQGADGLFYGTTESGGSHDLGTAFRVAPGGSLTTLFHFDGSHGAFPRAAPLQIAPESADEPAMDADEDVGELIFGVAGQGGAFGYGTVYRISGVGEAEVLFSFDATQGRNPHGRLVLGDDGELYGTAEGGGTSARGVAFRIGLDGEYRLLMSFDGPVRGANPEAAMLLGPDGDFYGTTQAGGENQSGVVFRLTPAGFAEALAAFGGVDGMGSRASLVLGNDGNFYGTTFETIFRVSPAGELATLHRFGGASAGVPHAGLLLASDGNFYGTTRNGGAAGEGAIYRMAPPPGAPSALTATSGNEEIHLTWSPVAAATTYNIYRGLESGSQDVLPLRSGLVDTAATLADLESGVYFFTVTAVSAAGESSPSNEAAVTVNIPDDFEFPVVSDARAGSAQFSAVIQLSGLVEDSTVPISIEGPADDAAFALNGGLFQTVAGRAGNGDTLQLRVTASNSPGATVRVRVHVGRRSHEFVVTSAQDVAEDPVPDPFEFHPLDDAVPDRLQVSNVVTVRGINVASTIAISGDVGASYSVNGGAFTASAGRVLNGDTVRVRVRAPRNTGDMAAVTLDIGGVSGMFSVVSGPDAEPDPFTILAVTDARPGSEQVSEPVVVSGLTSDAAISVVGAVGASYRINDGPFRTEAGRVGSGDRVQLRVAAPLAAGESVEVTLVIGAQTAQFSVTAGARGQSGSVDGGLVWLFACSLAAARIQRRRGQMLN